MAYFQFINTGKSFPYSYQLGIKSAKKHGKVKLWLVEKPDFDVDSLGVEVVRYDREIPDTKSLRKLSDHERMVAIFDYVAWEIMSREGGILMGLDSLTFGNLEHLLTKDMAVPKDSDEEITYSMHGVVVREGSELAQMIHELSKEALKEKIEWGDLGIKPFIQIVNQHPDKVDIIPKGYVGGAVNLFSDTGKTMVDNPYTIPVYATSRGDNFNKIDEKYVNQSENLYARLARKAVGRKLRFHLLGLVHLPVSERYMGCAFTQKIVKLSKMLLNLGHEVYLYGSEGSDAPCTKFIETHKLKDICDAWGEGDNRFEIGYDWKSKGFKHDFNSPRTETTNKYYKACINAINGSAKDDDFLLLSQGQYQKPIADGVKLFLTCEPGIGYRGSYTRFRAFESAYLQNFTYGSEHPRECINGNYYDRVIPNYFDAKDFKFNPEKKDYFLYIGRLITRKGIETAVKACKIAGEKLIIAGQGEYKPDYGEVIGYADAEKRNKLMGEARGVFVPTLYLEAFGGVAVEAQLCGTPVITTNFGVFPETVVDGVTGYRCNTLQDFVDATGKVKNLDYFSIRKHAERFLMDNVKVEFEQWFNDLYQLYLSAKDKNIQGWNKIR